MGGAECRAIPFICMEWATHTHKKWPEGIQEVATRAAEDEVTTRKRTRPAVVSLQGPTRGRVHQATSVRSMSSPLKTLLPRMLEEDFAVVQEEE